MLYVTTRISHDAFTAFRAMSENRGPEGGFYVPMRLPEYDCQQISMLAGKSFSHNMAQILNLFFGTKLEDRDLEDAVGGYPVKINGLNSRNTVIDLWRFEQAVSGIKQVICPSERRGSVPSDWLMMASRIAALFGVFGLLIKNGMITGRQKIDISLAAGDLSAVMAAWYARKMGLPIGTIVCCCNENSGLWNLFHKGALRTDTVAVKTDMPCCDRTVPTGLERLIFALSDHKEALRFCETVRKGGIYDPDPELLGRMREGIHVCVVGSKRVESVIPNLYKTSGFVADPYTALAYSGLTDYRAATGSNGRALMIAEQSPRDFSAYISRCMNIAPEELELLLL